MGISNSKVREHMEALFGADRLAELGTNLPKQTPGERESTIRGALADALQEMGGSYPLSFTFRRLDGRISHYISFVSKHPRGHGIMKDIMALESRLDDDGVPLFEYSPPGAARQLPLEYQRPILTLPEDLLRTFSGQTLRVGDIFDRHNVGKPFIKKNYKRVLLEMEDRGDVSCEPVKRRANTIADDVLVTFP